MLDMGLTFRLVLVFAAVAVGSVAANAPYGSATQAYKEPSSTIKTTRSPICLATQTGCSIALSSSAETPAKQPARGSNNIPPRRAQASTQPTKAECLTTQQTSAAYNQLALGTLAETNAQADNIRKSAELSGESYIDFDNQLNALFAAYNTKAQQAYDGYLESLHGCPAAYAPPLLFQMFTP